MYGIITLLLTTSISLSYGQSSCPAGGVVAGPGIGIPIFGPPGAVPGAAETSVLTEKGTINCYGVIKEWEFVIPGGCPATTDFQARFEVWRDTPVHTLVGYNVYKEVDCTTVGGNLVRLGVPANSRIPTAPNYIIGWTWLGGTVTLREAPGGGDVQVDDCSGTIPGATCTTGVTANVDHLLQITLIEGPAPSLDNLDASVDMHENQGPNINVMTLLATHPSNLAQDAGTLLVEPDAITFTFTLSTTDFSFPAPNFNNIGQIDLETNVDFDYESQTQHIVMVTVTALGRTVSGVLTVNVLDVNEAHLINLPSTVHVAITDPCLTNEVFTVTFTDVDTIDPTNPKYFNIKTATPDQPPSPFVIDQNTGAVFCTADLANWLIGDRLIHDLEVSVNDNMHEIIGTLTIEVQQANSPPEINNLPLTTNHPLNEDVSPGPVFTVTATGPNVAEIRFTMMNIIPREYFDDFVIDDVTGQVSLVTADMLDYSIYQTITITVGVHDNLHTLKQTATQNLVIDVQLVNRDPEYIPDEHFVTIDEECSGDPACNGIPGTFAWAIPGLVLNIVDREVDDPLLTDSLTCSVLPSHGSNFFDFQGGGTPMDCSTLFVVQRLNIDLAPQNQHINLTVRVQDTEGLVTSHGSVAKIHITVVDINDNSPIFNPAGPFNDTIPENTPGGVSVFTVTATDIDYNNNGEVSYSLLDTGVPGEPQGTLYFQIDEVTGLVTTKQAVDFENITWIPFTVRASDGGTNSRRTDVDAVITITDVNDIPPVWQQAFCDNRPLYYPYDMSAPCFFNDELRSDTLVNYHVMTIVSTDVDSPNGGLTYHLLEPNAYFRLGQITGDIKVNSSLSTYVKYILYCFSQDNETPNLLTQPHLRVRIDTFDPKRQLINIVLEVPMGSFNASNVQEGFLVELEKILNPWFPKIDQYSLDKDKTTVSIYALKDTSTYNEDNLAEPKYFVDRDDLLKILRKNIHGTPSDVLLGPPFAPYNPILVEPTYPIWILDTIPGLVTLGLICLAFVGLVVGLIVGLCHRYKKCCFKKKPQLPENRQWTSAKEQPRPKQDDYDKLSNHEDNRRPPPRERRQSIDTIHSLLFDNR